MRPHAGWRSLVVIVSAALLLAGVGPAAAQSVVRSESGGRLRLRPGHA